MILTWYEDDEPSAYAQVYELFSEGTGDFLSFLPHYTDLAQTESNGRAKYQGCHI